MSDESRKTRCNSRRAFLKAASLVPAAIYAQGCATSATSASPLPAAGAAGAMLDHAAAPLRRIRLAVIGTGQRGNSMLPLFAGVDGVEITAVCDTEPRVRDIALRWFENAGLPVPAAYGDGDYDYRRMLERDDIDAVYIATPWRWHTPMALDVMDSGRHALVEVPAALTIDECWQLVETSERTRQHCMMMENVCYGRDELMGLQMVRAGVLGELLHGEAAYIHELRWQMADVDWGTGSWRTGWHTRVNANLYPTHGLGPIAQYMNINRGDRFDYLTSMSSPARGRRLYAGKNFPADHVRNREHYVCGDINTSLIRTVRGRTIMVQHDTTTPRPYSRHNLIQGTGGVYAGFPTRYALESEGDFHHWQHDLAALREQYDHPLWRQIEEQAAAMGGHGGMDFVMCWRTAYCLRNGLPLDQNVYDAAAWSVVTPLSAASVADRGNSRDFPDFTRGAWKSAQSFEIRT